MFFIVATAASAVTEVISRLFTKRAGNLEHAINVMLSGPEPKGRGGAAPHEGQPPTRKARTPIIDAADTPMDAFKETSVWKMAQAAAGKSLILRTRSARVTCLPRLSLTQSARSPTATSSARISTGSLIWRNGYKRSSPRAKRSCRRSRAGWSRGSTKL